VGASVGVGAFRRFKRCVPLPGTMAPEEPGPVQAAQALLGTALDVKRGENVIIETWNHTLPYATACVVEARRRGAHPMLLLEDETAYWRSIDLAPSIAQWARVGRHEWAALAEADAYVFFPGPADRPRFRSLPAEHRSSLTGYNSEWYKRAEKSRLRGVRCVLGYASEAQAATWGVSASTWRNQLVRGMVDADPKTLRATADRVAKKLLKGKELRITAANGTDITLKLRGRKPLVDDGIVGPEDIKLGNNMTVSPPGTVALAVDERSAEGTAIANRPSFVGAVRLEGGQWEAHGGRLASAWYSEGQAAFDEQYGKAPKGKEIVSIFSLGINEALAGGVPQVEDQEAGAVTLGIGGNAAYGGSNKVPFQSWIVVGEATVAVDGAPLCDRGHIL
jgi:leucyl aminopeptidase (aminopeptidase T)